MNPTACLKRRLLAAALVWAFGPVVWAAALSEPPLVLYGKVIQQGTGAAYQLYDGDLVLTMANTASPSNQIVREVTLQPTGEASEFSYRMELPQKYLPEASELHENLVVGFGPTTYRCESIEVNGVPASPLDASQAEFTTSFASRAGQHRLDLLVSITEIDTDGDGMPDWWEDLHGLNRFSPTDALLDGDGDGLTNREELELGTDPNESNTSPLLRTPTVHVPAGGVAGMALAIVDSDSTASQIRLSLGADLPGLTIKQGTNDLLPGTSFGYDEVLGGTITLEAEADFAGGSIQLLIQDLGPGLAQAAYDLDIEVFTPMSQLGQRPAVWLDGSVVTGSPVDEWLDLSGNSRDGYQPVPGSQPLAGAGAVDFGGTGYLYLDERGLMFTEFTALAAFETGAIETDDQALLSSSDVLVAIRGDQSQALVIEQAGRTIEGPTLGAHTLNQVTLISGPSHAALNFAGSVYRQGQTATNSLAHAFATVGGAQPILQGTAGDLFNGRMQELLVYEGTLPPGDRTRNEDYQRSRWGTLVVWDGRGETSPLEIHGDATRPNAINGGWGNDHLTGGPWADVIRGGPGSDYLGGGSGPDIFHFVKESASDLIADYSQQEFDIIDLTDIFGDQVGVPSDFLTVRTEVIRDENNVPHVYTLLDLDYDGQGGGVDQTIQLVDTALSANDLELLVSKGLIRLGGPRYPGSTPILSYEDWVSIQYPGQSASSLAGVDTDGDGIKTIYEFLYDVNPHEIDDRALASLRVGRSGSQLEIEVVTREQYAGVELGLSDSLDLLNWTDADADYSLETEPLGHGRMRHLYRSVQPFTLDTEPRFLRLRATETPILP